MLTRTLTLKSCSIQCEAAVGWHFAISLAFRASFSQKYWLAVDKVERHTWGEEKNRSSSRFSISVCARDKQISRLLSAPIPLPRPPSFRPGISFSISTVKYTQGLNIFYGPRRRSLLFTQEMRMPHFLALFNLSHPMASCCQLLCPPLLSCVEMLPFPTHTFHWLSSGCWSPLSQVHSHRKRQKAAG